MTPLVSICIITRTRKEEMFETINNVLEQNYQNIEILVLDNGSDNEISLFYKSKLSPLPKIRLFRSEINLGVYTRNITK